MTNLASLREQKELRYAKKGLALALMSGMIWSSDGLILGKGLAEEPFGSPALWLFAPLLAAGLHDFCAACLSLAINGAQAEKIIAIKRAFLGNGPCGVLWPFLPSAF